MLPDLLRDADVGLLLVRRRRADLDVVDANNTASSLLGTVGTDVRGPVLPGIGLGRMVRPREAVERALDGEKSRWCTLVHLKGERSRHLNLCVTPFDGVPSQLVLVQVADLPHRQGACVDPGAVQ